MAAAARLRRLDLTAAVVDAGGGFDLGFTAALGQALGAPCFHVPTPGAGGRLPLMPAAPARWS
jgi:hypothetical protein